MASERIDRIRAALNGFLRTGEFPPGAFAPDLEIRQASSIVDTAGTFQGPGAIEEVLEELRESFDDLRFEPERFAEAPTGEVVVIVRVRGRGRGSGIEIDNQIAWVGTYDETDALKRLEVFEEPAEALGSVGLPRAEPWTSSS
jgi:ketosteroid isomerase-like protein